MIIVRYCEDTPLTTMCEEKLKIRIRTIAESLESKDGNMLMQALNFATKAHVGQVRKSGDPFIIHPLSVALHAWKHYKDPVLTSAALLHDVVEDCDTVTMKSIYTQFGDDIGFLVDAVTKQRSSFYKKKVYYKDKIERLLWAGLQDVRALLLKIADREHNIDTLKHLPSTKQVRMAFETQAIFEPLKQVLNVDTLRSPEAIQKKMQTCMSNKGIRSPKEMKHCLYSMSFKNFNHELFDLVYDNSNKVIWEIEDKKYFEALCAQPEFVRNVSIEQLWTDGDFFRAHFTFSSGYIMPIESGMAVSSYKGN